MLKTEHYKFRGGFTYRDFPMTQNYTIQLYNIGQSNQTPNSTLPITGCVNGCGYPPFGWENERARSVFIYCRSERISMFAVVLVNCDENNIPGCCNGNSYILSASTGFRFLRSLPPLISLSIYQSSYLCLSFSRFGTLGAAFDVCYRAWLNSNWKFTLGAVYWEAPSGCIFFLSLLFSQIYVYDILVYDLLVLDYHSYRVTRFAYVTILHDFTKNLFYKI